MMICVLGRQPEFGLAELESLYGSKNVRPLGQVCALVDAEVDFKRLGGSLKLAEHIATLPPVQSKNIFKHLAELLPEIIKTLEPEGKITLAISAYGLDISAFKLGGEALKLKKILRAAGRSARVVPNEETALSSAKTYHNRLATNRGIEFLVVATETETFIGRIVEVQNIDAYRIRDRNRPKRDAFVGMLPPKLAQIMINLAAGKLVSNILDPFCGTGVVLQEALLMGYSVYGSDISPKMIDFTQANLDWLEKTYSLSSKKDIKLEVADATNHHWDLSAVYSVVTEAYLGQPLGGQNPSSEKIQEIIHDTNTIIRGFLKNTSDQLEPGSRLCVAVPAWFIDDKEYHLPVIEELSGLGFLRVKFATASELIYRREDQITARELLVLEKARAELQ